MTDSPALLRALQQAGVRFIVIGGAASTAHGSARLTLDLLGEVAGGGSYENLAKETETIHVTASGPPTG